jgi:Uncharacterized homolog of PSP1
MTEVIGVRFKEVGKVYTFDPVGQQFAKGTPVIVETARGLECGTVIDTNHEVAEDKLVAPLKPIVRAATDADLKRVQDNAAREKKAYKICEEKIRAHELDMKLIDVEYTFDNSKVVFYFTADGRVDFRELVKDLAAVFHIRIELRQIGVRDESRMLGGIGVCGQRFCCCRFLPDFQSVTIRMAKEQGKSLSPTKISGACGRLMCCLKYEQDMYEELSKLTPSAGSYVSTPEGNGTVVEANVLMSNVKVRMDGGEAVKSFNSGEVVKLAGGKSRRSIAELQKTHAKREEE